MSQAMSVRSLIARYLSPAAKMRLRSWKRRLAGAPGVGEVNFGDLRRVKPFSDVFGLDRGLPVDRVYVEHFLEAHAGDIHGTVLEVAGDDYTRRFGGDRVERSVVLDVDATNPRATIIADLADAPHVVSEQFDAIVLTQTLQLIFDAAAAMRTLYRLLKPGGVLLLTVPGISSIGGLAGTRETWCWSFTEVSLRRLVQAEFGVADSTVRAYGNVLVATSFLQGLSAAELDPFEFEAFDPDYPVIVAARACKVDPST